MNKKSIASAVLFQFQIEIKMEFDERLALYMRASGRETCSEEDVLLYVLFDREKAAELLFYCQTTTSVNHRQPAEKYEQVACNVQTIMDESP